MIVIFFSNNNPNHEGIFKIASAIIETFEGGVSMMFCMYVLSCILFFMTLIVICIVSEAFLKLRPFQWQGIQRNGYYSYMHFML